jgi:hypothetical protein
VNDGLSNPAWSSTLTWVGRVISVLVILFLLFDGVSKLLNVLPVQRAMIGLGYPSSSGMAIGVIAIVCAALYGFPPTAVFGAVLITGLCGGAIASHLRIGSPLFSHTLFGLYIGMLAWAGVWLRNERLRDAFPG